MSLLFSASANAIGLTLRQYMPRGYGYDFGSDLARTNTLSASQNRT